MSRELLQQALDALEYQYHTYETRPIHNTDLAIDALRAALAQPAIDGFGGNLDSAFDWGTPHDASGAPWPDAAPAAREPMIDEMDAVASKYAHKMALDLECVLSNYIGPWYDTAMQTLSEYRMAMNAIHERESPTFMGEPDVRNRTSGGSAA